MKPSERTRKTGLPRRQHVYLSAPRRTALTRVLRARGWPRKAGVSGPRLIAEALDAFLAAQAPSAGGAA